MPSIDLDRFAFHSFGQTIQSFLRNVAVGDHDGITQVAAPDEVVLEEFFQFVEENEGTAGGDLVGVLIQAAQGSVLLAENGRVEVDHGHHLESVVGQGHQFGSCFLVAEGNGFFHHEVVAIGLLFLEVRLAEEVDKGSALPSRIGTSGPSI